MRYWRAARFLLRGRPSREVFMPRLLALLLALLLVPAAVAHAGPSAQKRELAAVYLYGVGLDEPDPGLVVMGVIGPEGVRCVYVQAGEIAGTFVADVHCEASKKARTGAKVRLVMLSGLESADRPSDRCAVRGKLRKRGVDVSCAVEMPILGVGSSALPQGHPLPGWAKKVGR